MAGDVCAGLKRKIKDKKIKVEEPDSGYLESRFARRSVIVFGFGFQQWLLFGISFWKVVVPLRAKSHRKPTDSDGNGVEPLFIQSLYGTILLQLYKECEAFA